MQDAFAERFVMKPRATYELAATGGLKYFRNTNFVKRDYETSNIVACVAKEPPAPYYAEVGAAELPANLDTIYVENGVRYLGYL